MPEVSLTHTPDLRVTDSVVTSMAYSGPFDALVTPQLLLKGGQQAGGSITGCGGDQTSITCNRHTHVVHIYRSQTGSNPYTSPGNKIVRAFNFKLEFHAPKKRHDLLTHLFLLTASPNFYANLKLHNTCSKNFSSLQ